MRLLSIVLLVLCLLPSRADAGTRAPPSPFLSTTDCFSSWPSYDAWLGGIRAKNPWWNPKALLLPWVFPRQDFERALARLECRAITYESDGLTIHGWMVLPKDSKGRKLPVIIYNRGGNGSFGAINFATLMQTVFPYAQEGFLVLATQYRGAFRDEPGRPGNDQFGGEDVRDVTRLVELVGRIPRADPDNIFMLGASRGAMMSFMAARRTDRIKAMAVIAGVSDLKAELRNRPEMEQVYEARIPHYAANKDRALAERSVLAWAQELPPRMPVLILHGSYDDRVHVSNALKLHRRLDQLGRPNKLVVYPSDNHQLGKNREKSRAEVIRWFSAAMALPPPASAKVAESATSH